MNMHFMLSAFTFLIGIGTALTYLGSTFDWGLH